VQITDVRHDAGISRRIKIREVWKFTIGRRQNVEE